MNNKNLATHVAKVGREEILLRLVDGYFYEYIYSLDSYVRSNRKQYESLEIIKKLRTKTVYEKVESLLSCIDDHIEGNLYNKINGKYHPCAESQKAVASTFLDDSLYRKVEKEVDWKDELKEFLSTPAEYNKFSQVALLGMAANLTESEFINMCHLVASLTDKPE